MLARSCIYKTLTVSLIIFTPLFAEHLQLNKGTIIYSYPEYYSRPVDTIKSETVVEVVERKDDWLLIQFSNGKAGWIKNGKYKRISPPPTHDNFTVPNEATPPQLKIQRVGNLREAPNLQSKIVEKLSPPQQVIQLGKEGEWYKVKTPSAAVGWINSILLQPPQNQPKSIELIKNGNLRSAPDFNAPVIKIVPAGKKVVVIDSLENWYKVRTIDTTGWMNKILFKSYP